MEQSLRDKLVIFGTKSTFYGFLGAIIFGLLSQSHPSLRIGTVISIFVTFLSVPLILLPKSFSLKNKYYLFFGCIFFILAILIWMSNKILQINAINYLGLATFVIAIVLLFIGMYFSRKATAVSALISPNELDDLARNLNLTVIKKFSSMETRGYYGDYYWEAEGNISGFKVHVIFQTFSNKNVGNSDFSLKQIISLESQNNFPDFVLQVINSAIDWSKAENILNDSQKSYIQSQVSQNNFTDFYLYIEKNVLTLNINLSANGLWQKYFDFVKGLAEMLLKSSS